MNFCISVYFCKEFCQKFINGKCFVNACIDIFNSGKRFSDLETLFLRKEVLLLFLMCIKRNLKNAKCTEGIGYLLILSFAS